MAKDEAEGKVLEKVRGVEKEQGSLAEVGSEPPPHYGHDSAKRSITDHRSPMTDDP